MLFRDLPGVTTCRFKQGEYLLRRGEPMPYVYYLKKGELHDVHTSCSSKMRKRIKLSYPILKLFITHTDIVIIFQHDIKSRLNHLSIHISMVC